MGLLSRTREAASGDGQKTCPTCNGDGKIRGDSTTCPDCNGTGKVDANFTREAETDGAGAKSGEDMANVACSACGGQGVKDGVSCNDCNGTGNTGGTTSAGDNAATPEVRAGGTGGHGNASTPEVRGDGGKGKQTSTSAGVPAGGPGGQQRAPEVQGPGGKGQQTVPEVRSREAAALAEAGPLAFFGDGSLRESWAVEHMSEKDYSTAVRVQAAKDGNAIPIRGDDGEITGGAFPILDGGDVQDAVSSIGRAGDPAAAKAHIVKQAKKFGATDKVPDDWKKSKEAGSLEDRVAALEASQQSIREAKPDYMGRVFEPTTRVTNSRGESGYLITLIREGDGNSADGRFYPGSALRELVESGRAEGMQAFANHPTLSEEMDRPERDVKELIGYHTDIKYVEEAGLPKVKSVFVPVTTNDMHPHYGWVVSLAEAATKAPTKAPLVGWSLFGLSQVHEGKKPDGSDGEIAEVILPSSCDLVTNAGAGGEFARQLMMESARRLRRATPTTHEEDPEMILSVYRSKMAEALKKVREASTDDERTAAFAEIATLEAEAAKIDMPKAPDTLEALTEAAPGLVAQLREEAKNAASAENQKLQETLTAVTDVITISGALREAGVTTDVDLQHYVSMARSRGLSTADEVKTMVETERAFFKAQVDDKVEAAAKEMREAFGDLALPDVEGVLARQPTAEDAAATRENMRSALREAGVPVKVKRAA